MLATPVGGLNPPISLGNPAASLVRPQQSMGTRPCSVPTNGTQTKDTPPSTNATPQDGLNQPSLKGRPLAVGLGIPWRSMEIR